MSKIVNKSASNAKTIKRVIGDLKPIWWVIAISAVVCLASVLLSSRAPEIVSELTDILYDYGETGKPIDLAYTAKRCIALALVYAGAALSSALMVVIMNNVSSRYYTKTMRTRISAKINHLPISFTDGTPHGELLSRMMNDVSGMSGTLSLIVETVISGFIKIVIVTVSMYLINPLLATAVVVLVPLSVLLSVKLASRSEKVWHEFRKTNGKLTALIEEDYSGFDTVKAFNLENDRAAKCKQLCNDYAAKAGKGYYLSGLVSPVISFTNNAAYVVVCVIGAILSIRQVVSVGDVMAIILFAKMFAAPLESIASGMGNIQYTLACAGRVYALLDEKEVEPQSSAEFFTQGNVQFRNVSFSYNPDQPLICNMNLNVKAGQKVAIVGPTGGGKTTIVNLLMRFYDPNEGNILIDGVDIGTVDRTCVRKLFGMVLQDTWLFNGTVYQNIAYGNPNATEEDVRRAAKAARIDGFIESLPNGYQTVIGESSSNVSGGQKQLLTIARTYLANRPMLILDEATSNVDTATELDIQRAMDELLKGRTSFVIAHRLSTIVNSDVILVVENGTIVEQGTHAELLAKNGAYTALYNSQYRVLK